MTSISEHFQAANVLGRRKVRFGVQDFYLSTTFAAGAKTTATDGQTNSIGVTYFPFDSGSVEKALFDFIVPESMDVSQGFEWRVYWTSNSTNTGDVMWELRVGSGGDNADLNGFHGGGGDTVLDAGLGTAKRMHISPVGTFVTGAITGASPGDKLQLAIFRLGSNVSDTFSADAWLLGVEVAYFMSQVTDD